MAKVGLIGVGNMGGGMSRNILKAGHQLTMYDVRPEAMGNIGSRRGSRCGLHRRETWVSLRMLFLSWC